MLFQPPSLSQSTIVEMASPPSRMVMTNTNTERSRDSKRRRKKKVQQQQQQQQQQSKWKSQAQQQIYSSKLRQALARVPRRAKAVREAADRVLAATAKGRSRWSRAILTNRLKLKLKLKLKFSKQKRHRIRPSKKPRLTVYRLKGKSVQRKVRFLGRLVPGCRKQPLPVILQETIDYIPALQMQIRAMTNLVNLLAASSSSSSSSSAQ